MDQGLLQACSRKQRTNCKNDRRSTNMAKKIQRKWFYFFLSNYKKFVFDNVKLCIYLDLLKPGAFPEELFQLGAMFYKNKDKNGYPLCN